MAATLEDVKGWIKHANDNNKKKRSKKITHIIFLYVILGIMMTILFMFMQMKM